MTPMLFSSGAIPVAPEGGTFTLGAVPGAPEGTSDGTAAAGNMDALAAFDVALLDVLVRAAATAADASSADGESTGDVLQSSIDGTVTSALWPVAPQTIGVPAAAFDGDEDALSAVDNEEEPGEEVPSRIDIVTMSPWPLAEQPLSPSQWSIPESIRDDAVEDGRMPAAVAAGATTVVREVAPQTVAGDTRSVDPARPTHGAALTDATTADVPSGRVTDGHADGMRENARTAVSPSAGAPPASNTAEASGSEVTDHRNTGVSPRAQRPVDAGGATERDAALDPAAERSLERRLDTQATPDKHREVAGEAERTAAQVARALAPSGAAPASRVSRETSDATMSTPIFPSASIAPGEGVVSAASAAVAARASAQTPDRVASESGQVTPEAGAPATSFGAVPSPEAGEKATADGRRGRGREHDVVASEAVLLRRSASLEARLAPPASFALGSATPLSLSALTSQALTGAAGGPLPFDMPAPADNLSKLVQSIRVQARDSVSQASVRLNPEHLGEVTMTVRVEGGVVNAVVRAESGDVRQWLRGQEDSIRASLAEQGLTLDELIVDEDGRREQQHHAEDDMPRRPRTRSGRAVAATFEITA